MKRQRVAAFGGSRPRRGLTGEGDLLAAEARLVADDGTGATLTLQAVADGDARWLAHNRKVKLPATTGGASGGYGSAPWLSLRAKCRLDFEHWTMGSASAPALPVRASVLNALVRKSSTRGTTGFVAWYVGISPKSGARNPITKLFAISPGADARTLISHGPI